MLERMIQDVRARVPRMFQVLILFLGGLGVLSVPMPVSAATLEFSGTIGSFNEVVRVDFKLDGVDRLELWTDSVGTLGGFDPILALWDSSGHRLSLNDDDASFSSDQGSYDSGISIDGLAAGSYSVTISAAGNTPRTSLLSDGFEFDGLGYEPIQVWDLNSGNGQYHLLVEHAMVTSVPLPGAIWLMGSGLIGFLGLARRRRALV